MDEDLDGFLLRSIARILTLPPLLPTFMGCSKIEKFVVEWSDGVIVAGSTAVEVLDKLEVYQPPKSRFALQWDEVDTPSKENFV